ncbi:hypothetical protein BH11BAC2_BH11BAC2_08130 [soil metagenome]
MGTQSQGVKKLLKELEAGKKQLKADYERSLRALDETIKVLKSSKMDLMDVVKTSAGAKKRGRPAKGNVNVSGILKKAKGKRQRGRPKGSTVAHKGNLTQTLFDLVAGKKRFVHSRDIVEAVIKRFPKEDRTDFAKKISVLLASLKRQNRLVTYQDGGYRKNMYWGLNEWLTPEGRISKGKEFKKS